MVFAIITAVSYLYISNMQEYIKNSSLEKLEIIGSATNDKINLYVQQQQDKVELFNTRKYLYNKLTQYARQKTTKTQVIIENILEFAYSKEEDIIDIVILDNDYDIIASKLKKVTSQNSFLLNLKQKTSTSSQLKLVFKNTSTAPLLYISSPLFNKDRLIGTTIFIIKLNYFNKFLTNKKQLGQTGEVFMSVKSKNKLIIFTPLKETSHPVISQNQTLIDCAFSKEHHQDSDTKRLQETVDYRGKAVVFSLHHNKILQLIILVKQDLAEIMEPIERIKLNQLIILCIGSLFILLTGLFISNKMIEIINNLVRITSNISDGKLNERINIDSDDEFGTLARSVNKMADFMINANAISEAKVIEKTKLLQESNKNLSRIIKSLSHDIKTPLTVINGYLEEIDDGLVKVEDLPKVTAILKKETAYLNELSTEVIRYIQSKEVITDKKEKILLEEFLNQEVYPLLRITQGVELKCECSSTEQILFNKTALKKILVNLLHNASKYTTSGYITIKQQKHTLLVEDTGIGIDPQYAENIFEPFFGLDESRNRELNGFGLGLSIAKNLARSNDYELELDSSYKNGCRFVLKQVKIKRNSLS